MVLLVFSFLIIGYISGLFFTKHTIITLKTWILPSAFIMLWAIMTNMDAKRFVNVLKYPKELTVGAILSLVVAPLLMLPLAMIFAKNPKIYSGLILAGIVPPGGFLAYWSSVLYADIALAIAIELTTFIIALFWIPYGMKWLVGSKVNVKVSFLFHKIVILLVIPFILATITRWFLTKKNGEQGLKNAQPVLHSISSLMAFFLVFTGTGMKSKMISHHPAMILLPAIGALLYYLIAFPLIYLVSKKLFRYNFNISIPLTYGTGTKNLSIAMGLAATAFGPLTLLGVIVCMLFQMPLAAIWYKIFDKIRVKKESLIIAAEEELEEIEEKEVAELEKNREKGIRGN